MRIDWHVYHHEGRSCEVQLWEPDGPCEKLLLFCPGFPGRGGTMFEQRHAATFVEAGYTVAVIKHAGTRLDGPDAPFIVNNGARLAKGRREKETHLGGGPSTMLNWLWEPHTALKALQPAFKQIDIYGNSFGAISMLWSLTRPDAYFDNIRTLACVAGAQGVDTDPISGAMRVWSPMHLMNPIFWEKITLDDPNSIHDTMKIAYAEIAARAPSFPAHVRLKYLVVMQDEILKLSDTQAFKKVMGDRGDIVIDDIDRAYPAMGFIAHDMADYPTEKLLELYQ